MFKGFSVTSSHITWRSEAISFLTVLMYLRVKALLDRFLSSIVNDILSTVGGFYKPVVNRSFKWCFITRCLFYSITALFLCWTSSKLTRNHGSEIPRTYNRQQNYSSIWDNSSQKNSYLIQFYEINICQIMIFRLCTDGNNEITKIANQTRENSQVLSRVLE